MPTTTLSPHLSFIQQRLPAWLNTASVEQRQLLRTRVLASQASTRKLGQVLTQIQGIDTFCRPLLTEALADWFPDRKLPQVDTGYLWDNAESRGLSWLEAALHNFDQDAAVRLYASSGQTMQTLPIDAERFVKGVRNLDLGQRYRNHLDDLIDTDDSRNLIAAQDRDTFAAQLTMAHLQGRLDERGLAMGEALITGAKFVSEDSARRTLEHGYLTLFGQPLNGPLLIRLNPEEQVEPCLLYLPGDPVQPLAQYASMSEVARALTERLTDHVFRAFFCRYISHAQQPLYAEKLRRLLYPFYPYAELLPGMPVLERGQKFSWLKRMFPGPRDLWQETLDRNARVPLDWTPWNGDCFDARARTWVERKLEDAASIAVPVAQRDADAQLAQIERWLGAGMSLLNVAGLFVPGLGEVMLVIGGAQLIGEFLEGVHLANEGDAQAAVEHLFDVLENLVQFAALGAAAGLEEPAGALHDWFRIGSAEQQRLWHGDLTPFSHPRPWPAGTPLTPEGLRLWQGRHWMELDGNALVVTPEPGRSWQLRLKGQRQAPGLLGNGQGSWVMEHEAPQSWEQSKLLQRLGPVATGITPDRLDIALRCSGYDAQALRQIHVDHRPIPALLLDSLQALDARTDELLLATPVNDAALARDFPSLSPRARKEILDQTPDPFSNGRVPLAVAEKARLYLREARINRALARFHQSTGATSDRDNLIFAALPRLPGWTGEVRLELRENLHDGALQASAGSEQGVHKTIVRSDEGYTAHDETGQELSNRSTVFQAILQALPDSEREALGLQIHDREALRDRLFDLLAGDRAQTARDLGMPSVRPLYRLPTRLPGTRRIGYALSGRGSGLASEQELFQQLFPNLADDENALLQAHLRERAGTAPGAFVRLLEQMRSEYRQLDGTLQHWVSDTTGANEQNLVQRRTARDIVAQRIRMAWRRENATGATASWNHVVLDIDARQLGRLPTLSNTVPHVRQLNLTGLTGWADSNLDGFLQAFPGLRHLDLSANALPTLPQTLGTLRELQILDLGENALDIDNPQTLAILTRLTRLQQLNLTEAIETLAPATLEQMAQLPALHALQLDQNELVLDERHFQALQRWPSLRYLSLGNNNITLTDASRTALAGLNHLQRLHLYENPLELAPDVTGWSELEQLDLEMTHITQWPTGLDELMDEHPLTLTAIDLSHNDLTTIPTLQDTLFARAVQAHDPDIRFSINDNPLTEQALLDLEAAGMSAIRTPEASNDWASDWPPELRTRIQATRQDPQWSPLYALFDRLVVTAEYQAHPQAMAARMRNVIRRLVPGPEAAAEPIWGRAQVRERIMQRLTEGAQTCVDQSALQFQQIETEMVVWQAVAHAAPGLDDEQVAIDGLTSLLHERLLDERVAALFDARVTRRRALAAAEDDIAREAAPALHPDDDLSDPVLSAADLLLDEMEMALHARIHLRERLGLPPQPEAIAFDYLANLSEATLERLATAVLAQSTGQRLSELALQEPFWEAWLRRLRPEAFEALDHEWEGASYYFDALNEAPETPGAYAGPAVPASFIEALERDLAQIPWRQDGVLQRVDLVSGEYANGETVYQRAAQLLLSTRQQAERELLQNLTTEVLAAGNSND